MQLKKNFLQSLLTLTELNIEKYKRNYTMDLAPESPRHLNIGVSSISWRKKKKTHKPQGSNTNESGAGDLSACVRDMKWGLDIPACSVVMWHYACRPPGNEPPLLKMKWAVSNAWSGTRDRVPLHSLDKPSWSYVQTQLPDLMGVWWSRCMNVLYNECGTQTWLLIHSSPTHKKKHPPKNLLLLLPICERFFFFFFPWLSLITVLSVFCG